MVFYLQLLFSKRLLLTKYAYKEDARRDSYLYNIWENWKEEYYPILKWW